MLPAAAWSGTFTFGVVPQQDAIRTAQIWGPVLQHLSEQTGHRFELKTAKDIPTFESVLAEGGYDFAYMNPYHFVVFNERVGYQALAHRQGPGIRGVIVVPTDSDFYTLEDLDGATVGFPAPAAFAATLINRAEILATGVSIQPRFTRSHDSVYRAVAAGLLPAGGGIGRTLNAMPDDTRAALRILHKTREYTPHAIAAHPSIIEPVFQQVQQALADMPSELTQSQLKVAGWKAADSADWDDVRVLNLQAIE